MVPARLAISRSELSSTCASPRPCASPEREHRKPAITFGQACAIHGASRTSPRQFTGTSRIGRLLGPWPIEVPPLPRIDRQAAGYHRRPEPRAVGLLLGGDVVCRIGQAARGEVVEAGAHVESRDRHVDRPPRFMAARVISSCATQFGFGKTLR
jgi:hypothetical protein